MNSIDNLKKELLHLGKLKVSTERTVAVAALVAEALQQIGQEAVLVGGSAVDFYTMGSYATEDIDMVCEGGPELARVMEALGFEKFGKDFVHAQAKLYLEFPSRSLGFAEEYRIYKVGNRMLKIISIEGLILDRLASFQHWQCMIDGINALLLLETADLDAERLWFRARQADLEKALHAVEKVREDAIRKKLSPSQASQSLEAEMKKLRRD